MRNVYRDLTLLMTAGFARYPRLFVANSFDFVLREHGGSRLGLESGTFTFVYYMRMT